MSSLQRHLGTHAPPPLRRRRLRLALDMPGCIVPHRAAVNDENAVSNVMNEVDAISAHQLLPRYQLWGMAWPPHWLRRLIIAAVAEALGTCVSNDTASQVSALDPSNDMG